LLLFNKEEESEEEEEEERRRDAKKSSVFSILDSKYAFANARRISSFSRRAFSSIVYGWCSFCSVEQHFP
jgi:hypothetical protein